MAGMIYVFLSPYLQEHSKIRSLRNKVNNDNNKQFKKTSRIGSRIYESHFSMAKFPVFPSLGDLEVLVSESTWEVLKAKLWATPGRRAAWFVAMLTSWYFSPTPLKNTVDGRNPAPNNRVGGLSHYLQGFIHPRWCRISSINSMMVKMGSSSPRFGGENKK